MTNFNMADNKEPRYLDGLIVKRPHENAPDFVKCSLSFKVDEFIKALQENAKNGWVNADMKVSKKGALYISINDFEPKEKKEETPKELPVIQQEPPTPTDEIITENIPF